MSRARRFRPSDVVVWNHTDGHGFSKSTLAKLGTATRFVDRQDSNNRTGYFRCQYIWTGVGHPDPLANDWTLITEGAEVGGRRYRHWVTVEAAQRIALAWLDRRFAAVDAETGEPVEWPS